MKQLSVRTGRILVTSTAAAAILGTAFTGGVSFASTNPGTHARAWAVRMGTPAQRAHAITWGAAPLGVAAPAPLPCRASMNNSQPQQYTTVKVRIRTASKAGVTTVAHYKTTSHKKTGQAGRRGRLSIPYSISDATIGYTVVVSVTVSKAGRTGSCSTSFTPQG